MSIEFKTAGEREALRYWLQSRLIETPCFHSLANLGRHHDVLEAALAWVMPLKTPSIEEPSCQHCRPTDGVDEVYRQVESRKTDNYDGVLRKSCVQMLKCVKYLQPTQWADVAINRASLGQCGWLGCINNPETRLAGVDSSPWAIKMLDYRLQCAQNFDTKNDADFYECFCSLACIRIFRAIQDVLSDEATYARTDISEPLSDAFVNFYVNEKRLGRVVVKENDRMSFRSLLDRISFGETTAEVQATNGDTVDDCRRHKLLKTSFLNELSNSKDMDCENGLEAPPEETHQAPEKPNQAPEKTNQAPEKTNQAPEKTNQAPENTQQAQEKTSPTEPKESQKDETKETKSDVSIISASKDASSRVKALSSSNKVLRKDVKVRFADVENSCDQKPCENGGRRDLETVKRAFLKRKKRESKSVVEVNEVASRRKVSIAQGGMSVRVNASQCINDAIREDILASINTIASLSAFLDFDVEDEASSEGGHLEVVIDDEDEQSSSEEEEKDDDGELDES